ATAQPPATASAALARPARSVAPIEWSAPRDLRGCAAAGPQVAFPSEGPFDPTGPGAIAWVRDERACAHGEAASAPELLVSPLRLGARVAAAYDQPLSYAAAPAVSVVGASFGRVAVALAPANASEVQARPAVLEGRAGGRLVSALHGGSGLAIARAYLGDVAVATVKGRAISVRVQRWFGRGFEGARLISIPAGAVSALTVTLDYRSDVLVAWQQNGFIYAHMLRASGVPQPTQRVGASAPDPQLRALVSDNDRGMLAWSSTEGSGPRARTRIELAFSKQGVRFLAPTPLASFTDPLASGRTPGSLQLVRLSTENVLLAWTVREGGRYVVRAAPAVFAATRRTARLSDPAGDAVLADLATGPAAEAVALWRVRGDGEATSPQEQLWAARVMLARGDRPIASPARMVAPAGPVAQASVGVDPASDRPLAAWRSAGASSRVQFAAGVGAGGYRPRAAGPVAPSRGGRTHWLRIVLAAIALALVAIAAVVLRARSGRRAARS
ncbi:MAG TPA: hypothetical protein VH115_03105, partial [Solirubrobacteraceae bacterium]|nr:hypothetical protein [Solirubrobacteraceae bacterium]